MPVVEQKRMVTFMQRLWTPLAPRTEVKSGIPPTREVHTNAPNSEAKQDADARMREIIGRCAHTPNLRSSLCLPTLPTADVRDEYDCPVVLFGGRAHADQLLVVPKQ